MTADEELWERELVTARRAAFEREVRAYLDATRTPLWLDLVGFGIQVAVVVAGLRLLLWLAGVAG